MSQAVYRSAASEVVAAMVAGADAERAHMERLEEALIGWGFPPKTSTWWQGNHCSGVEVARGDEVPSGWRRNKDGRAIPNLRTTVGKAANPEWSRLRKKPSARTPLEAVGMPGMLFVGHHLCRPGMGLVGGEVWAHWSEDPDGSEAKKPSPIGPLWSRVSLSEYYALVEAGKDPIGKYEPAEATP